VNGRELVVAYRLLRNSTKIAAQFSGLEQCSQKAPVSDDKLKQRPNCSHHPPRRKTSFLPLNNDSLSLKVALRRRIGCQFATGLEG